MSDRDTSSVPRDSAEPGESQPKSTAQVHVPKDRSCPYCKQPFTSSSLGRHLDLYIKPKNPKPPDGIHDVEEIRRIRGGITRRQPRTSKEGAAKRERSEERASGDDDVMEVDRQRMTDTYPMNERSIAPDTSHRSAHHGYSQFSMPQSSTFIAVNPVAPRLYEVDEPQAMRGQPLAARSQLPPQLMHRQQDQHDSVYTRPPASSPPTAPLPPPSSSERLERFDRPPPILRRSPSPVTMAGYSYPEPSSKSMPYNWKKDARGYKNFINRAHWAATGVINDLPPRIDPLHSTTSIGTKAPSTGGLGEYRLGAEAESRARAVEEEERGEAAVLALREVLGCVKAASTRNDLSAILGADILSLDFPALCLRLLPAPTTLFTPHPWPTYDSWPIDIPGLAQADALQQVIELSLRKQRDRNAFNHPLSRSSFTDSSAFAMGSGANDSQRIRDHIGQAYSHWMRLTESERRVTWQLESLRAFARAEEGRKEADMAIETLRSQVDQMHEELTQLRAAWKGFPTVVDDQPSSELRLASIAQVKLDSETLKQLAKQGLNLRNWDLETLLDKWRTVVKEERKSAATLNGLQPSSHVSAASTLVGMHGVGRGGSSTRHDRFATLSPRLQQQQHQQQQQRPPPLSGGPQMLSANSASAGVGGPVSGAASTSTSNSASDPSSQRGPSSTSSPYSTANIQRGIPASTHSHDSPASLDVYLIHREDDHGKRDVAPVIPVSHRNHHDDIPATSVEGSSRSHHQQSPSDSTNRHRPTPSTSTVSTITKPQTHPSQRDSQAKKPIHDRAKTASTATTTSTPLTLYWKPGETPGRSWPPERDRARDQKMFDAMQREREQLREAARRKAALLAEEEAERAREVEREKKRRIMREREIERQREEELERQRRSRVESEHRVEDHDDPEVDEDEDEEIDSQDRDGSTGTREGRASDSQSHRRDDYSQQQNNSHDTQRSSKPGQENNASTKTNHTTINTAKIPMTPETNDSEPLQISSQAPKDQTNETTTQADSRTQILYSSPTKPQILNPSKDEKAKQKIPIIPNQLEAAEYWEREIGLATGSTERENGVIIAGKENNDGIHQQRGVIGDGDGES